MYSDDCKNASKCASFGNYKQKRNSCEKNSEKSDVNMDIAKYQSDIIHDIEMTCNCAVF